MKSVNLTEIMHLPFDGRKVLDVRNAEELAVPGTKSKSSTGIARWRFESRVLRNRVPGTISNKTTRLIRNGQPLVCYAYVLVDTF